jgi:site-specific DNA-adenine methylase
MGWGGRLVGACALNIPKYVGIDSNKNLEQPYSLMKTFLNKHSTTEIDLRFQDALEVDYSAIQYDLVLTSPPYYNIETYGSNTQREKDDWDEKFYKPIFAKTFQYLQKGGYYCINIPVDVYENVAIQVLGNSDIMIPLPKSKRSQTESYNEFIYVWKK